MKDKKAKIKDKTKKFAIDYAAPTVCVLVSYAVGVHLGNKVYKSGYDAGYDQLANTIYNASRNGGGILLSNKEVGDVIFKATKVLTD